MYDYSYIYFSSHQLTTYKRCIISAWYERWFPSHYHHFLVSWKEFSNTLIVASFCSMACCAGGPFVCQKSVNCCIIGFMACCAYFCLSKLQFFMAKAGIAAPIICLLFITLYVLSIYQNIVSITLCAVVDQTIWQEKLCQQTHLSQTTFYTSANKMYIIISSFWTASYNSKINNQQQ